MQLYKATKAKGASITSAGSLRGLNAKLKYGRDPTPLHYVGIAFDMSVYAGGHKPDKDPMVIVEDPDLGKRRWRVYLRATGGKEMVLNATKFVRAGKGIYKRTTVKTKGMFIDFTALAASIGFIGVSAWASAWAGAGKYGGMEF
jgi:hypothetical protein